MERQSKSASAPEKEVNRVHQDSEDEQKKLAFD
jgi:hypothetical protein